MSTVLARTQTATADETGAATVSFGPPDGGYQWTVEAVAVSTSAGQACPCAVAVDGTVRCWTTQGQQDNASGAPAIVLQPTNVLTVTWSDAGAGATCSATIDGTIDPLALSPRPVLG